MVSNNIKKANLKNLGLEVFISNTNTSRMVPHIADRKLRSVIDITNMCGGDSLCIDLTRFNDINSHKYKRHEMILELHNYLKTFVLHTIGLLACHEHEIILGFKEQNNSVSSYIRPNSLKEGRKKPKILVRIRDDIPE